MASGIAPLLAPVTPRLSVGAVAFPVPSPGGVALVAACDPSVSVAVAVTVRLAVPAKLPAGTVSVRLASCAAVSDQLPSAFLVPAESVALLGTPAMLHASVAVAAVALSGE